MKFIKTIRKFFKNIHSLMIICEQKVIETEKVNKWRKSNLK